MPFDMKNRFHRDISKMKKVALTATDTKYPRVKAENSDCICSIHPDFDYSKFWRQIQPRRAVRTTSDAPFTFRNATYRSLGRGISVIFRPQSNNIALESDDSSDCDSDFDPEYDSEFDQCSLMEKYFFYLLAFILNCIQIFLYTLYILFSLSLDFVLEQLPIALCSPLIAAICLLNMFYFIVNNICIVISHVLYHVRSLVGVTGAVAPPGQFIQSLFALIALTPMIYDLFLKVFNCLIYFITTRKPRWLETGQNPPPLP